VQSLIRHRPHWKRFVQQLFYCCMCIYYSYNFIFVNVNRNKYPVVRPSWALKPGLTDRLTLTLTLTLLSRCLATIRVFLPSRCLVTIGGILPSRFQATIRGFLPSRCLATIRGDTQTQQRDLISLVYFFIIRNVGQKVKETIERCRINII
jgi:hypothetical protein